MFGGLIAHAGRVAEFRRDPRGGVRLSIEAPAAIAEGVDVKDSIAIDGVCLTVVENDARVVQFDVVPETLARSTLGGLHLGARVNVELSLRLGERLGGHFVYGHVDATTPILAKVPVRLQGAGRPGQPRDRSRGTLRSRRGSRVRARGRGEQRRTRLGL